MAASPWQTGQTPFTKRQAELFFPPEFGDDFPVSMHISEKYGVIYVVTKNGLLFVYDLETATAIYRNKISNDPIFIACGAPSNGGCYVVNRRGQVGRGAREDDTQPTCSKSKRASLKGKAALWV